MGRLGVEEYTDALVPLAMRLVAAVHDEGPDDTASIIAAVAAIEPPAGVDPGTALAVVLAAAVDPGRTVDGLLGWTRALAGPALAVQPERAGNSLACEMALAGVLPLRALTREQASQVVDVLVDRGWSLSEVADHLDAHLARVTRIRNANLRRRRKTIREDEAA